MRVNTPSNENCLFVFSIVIVFFLCFYPGLFGSFLFDDYANLNKLGDYNGVRNLDTFLKYISSGIAGPTGRPISLLSFLLDGTDWPTDPFPFKRTNVLLHGLSGIFLYLLCRQLLLCFYLPSSRLNNAALLVAALWLLHPYMVSTVLYVVQRMAMLSAFFSILGLWLYVKGRRLLAEDPHRAYAYMTGAVVLGTLLALLSKENGILLPLLIAMVELCVFRHPSSGVVSLNKLWQITFILLPSLAIFAYLIYVFNPYTLDHPFYNRTFNLPQRVLTESRIVIGYLYHLYIPRMFYPGLLNENIELSTGLLAPPTTLYSVIALSLMLFGAIAMRKRWPLLSLSWLFFLAGHVLESTTIGLELYFEHRNYLPAIFLFLPLGSLLIRVDRRMLRIGSYLFLAICAAFTYQRSQLWGNPLELTLFWAERNPHSSRAQRTAALQMEQADQPLAALTLLTQARHKIPDNLDLQWHWLILKCRFDEVTESEFSEIRNQTSKLDYVPQLFNMLQSTIQIMSSPECKGVSALQALQLLDTLINDNPSVQRNSRLRFQMYHLKGKVYAEIKKPKLAVDAFNRVLDMEKNIEHGLVQVGILGSHRYYQEALEHLQKLESLIQTQPGTNILPLDIKPDYRYEVERIKQILLEELDSVKTE